MLAGAAATGAIHGRSRRLGSLVDPTTAAAASTLHLLRAATHLEVGLLGAASEGGLATRGLEASLLEDALERLDGRAAATTGTSLTDFTSCIKGTRHLFVLTPTEFYAEQVTQDGGSTVNCWALATALVRR